jgi:hypothetical protein
MSTIQNDALITAAKPKILVFPNKLDNELFESNECEAGKTLHQWLVANVPAYVVQEVALFSATLNNQAFDQIEWQCYQLKSGDVLALTVEAKDPITIVIAVIAVIAVGVSMYTMNTMPDNYNNTTPDGSSIYDANVQGNRPRLMGVIPELAGRHKIFPDHLNMPRREFINNEQWIYLMMSAGVGELEINPEEIFIGDTPLANYAGDAFYNVFQPGEDVTGHEAFRNIYTSAEVGGTAGTTGIELKGSVTSAGSTSGGGLRWDFINQAITVYRLIRVSRSDTDYRKIPFPFVTSEIVTVTGAAENNGDYRVVSVDNSTGTMQKLDAQGADDAAWFEFTIAHLAAAKLEVVAGGGDGEYNGAFFACPRNETTQTLWLDFKLPQGLGELDDGGTFLTKTVDINIQYRHEGDGAWVDVPHSFTDSTNDELAETLKINLPSAIRPEVQVKRVTGAEDNTRIYDKVEWTALKSELESATSYADVTTIAIKVRGTNALSNSAENKFNLIATRKLPIYQDDAWTEPQATTDIAPFFAHVIKDVGHGDEQIGLTELARLHGVWQGRNDEFNAVFDNDSTLFNVLKRVLSSGFAEPTLDYGQIIPVRDEPRTGFDYMYQPENMKTPLKREIKLFDPDEPDGIEVEYFSDTTWKPETVLCLLDGELGIKPKKVRAFGITNKTKAWQFGMRKRREIRYRRTKYNFTTEMDALNSSYLSYDALADDIPGYSQTGKITDVNGRALTLSEPLEWGVGTHFISLRKPDGTLSGPYICTAIANEYSVLLSTDLDFIPDCSGRIEPSLFQFGAANRWCLPALVTDVKPSGTDKVSVTAVNYDARVYADDDNLPPV